MLSKYLVLVRLFIEIKPFQFLLESLSAENLVCIAYDLSGDTESILTNSIKGWQKTSIKFEKKPCIFLVN